MKHEKVKLTSKQPTVNDNRKDTANENDHSYLNKRTMRL